MSWRRYDLLHSDAIKEWGIKAILPLATIIDALGCFPLHFKMDKSGVTARYSSSSVLCEFTTAAGSVLIVVLMVKSAWLTTDDDLSSLCQSICSCIFTFTGDLNLEAHCPPDLLLLWAIIEPSRAPYITLLHCFYRQQQQQKKPYINSDCSLSLNWMSTTQHLYEAVNCSFAW